MLLQGKKALVTGGSRGIGREIARTLAREGADVAFTYHRDAQAAEQTANAIRAEDRRALVIRANFADTGQIERVFEEFSNTFGHLDIFIWNAVSAILRPILQLQSRHWTRVLNANLTAFFECIGPTVRLMNGEPGRIVAITSLGSRLCAPGYAALGAAKAGVETLARYLAVELADKNINVNVVCPGMVDTNAFRAFGAVVPDLARYKQSLADRTPRKQIARPADVAQVVLFLCTSQADWIRGQTITADGGFSLAM